jgi:hypothetical protein
MKSVIKTAALIAAILGVVVILVPAWRDWIVNWVIKPIPPPPPPVVCGAPTGGPASSTMITGISITADGKPLTGTADIPAIPRINYPITITNATTAPTTIDAIQLWESVDNKFIPELELKPECRYMSISGGDCSPASLPVTLAPNATCSVTLGVGRPQTGRLDISTGLGQVQIALSAHP